MSDGIGRVLGADLAAVVDVPPFDNSAMDGFAVRAADLSPGVRLAVVGDIPAGATTVPTVGEGQAARIMTGAALPPGADAVVPVEQTDQPTGDPALPATVLIAEPVSQAGTCAVGGKTSGRGRPWPPAGLRWTAAAASAAVSLGHGSVLLVRRPRVAVLSTGLRARPRRGAARLRPDPRLQLCAPGRALSRLGAEVISATAVDDYPDHFAALAAALSADLVLTSGECRWVRSRWCGRWSRATSSDKVAMQPGKPQASGTLTAPDGRRVPMLGLPGNPVSVCRVGLGLRPAASSPAWATGARRGHRRVCPWRRGGGACRSSLASSRRCGSVPRACRRCTWWLGSGSHLVVSLALADGLAVVPGDVESVERATSSRCIG